MKEKNGIDQTKGNGKAKTAFLIVMILLNALAAGFNALYVALWGAEGTVTNVFGTVVLVTYVLDIFYGAFTKRRSGLLLIIGTGLGMVAVFAMNYAATMLSFYHSWSIVSLIINIAIPVCSITVLYADLAERPIKERRFKKAYSAFKFVTALIAPLALALLMVMGVDTVTNDGYSKFEALTSNAAFAFIFVAFAFVMYIVRVVIVENAEGGRNSRHALGISLKKTLPLTLCCVIMGSVAIGGFGMQFGAALSHTAPAAAGGVLSLEEASAKYDGMRKTVFSVPDLYTGIKTRGYTAIKNVEYYNQNSKRIPEAEDKNPDIRLSYDILLPEAWERNTGNGKTYPVLIRFHGRNRDKGDLNMPQTGKYFAMQGYAVYDVQYGDWDELQEPATEREFWLRNEEYLFYISQFFEHATANNIYGADFSRTVISGHSFGGQFAMLTALTIDNPDADNLLKFTYPDEITVKGVVAFYPGYLHETGVAELENPLYEYSKLVRPDSPPCLMFCGTNDGFIKREVTQYVGEAYKNAGNPYFGFLELDYTAHGFDGYFAGTGAQYSTYYMERFLYKYA